MCKNRILWNAMPFGIDLSECVLGPCMALPRCQAMPLHSRLEVMHHSQATSVEESKVILCPVISFFRQRKKERRRNPKVATP